MWRKQFVNSPNRTLITYDARSRWVAQNVIDGSGLTVNQGSAADQANSVTVIGVIRTVHCAQRLLVYFHRLGAARTIEL